MTNEETRQIVCIVYGEPLNISASVSETMEEVRKRALDAYQGQTKPPSLYELRNHRGTWVEPSSQVSAFDGERLYIALPVGFDG